MKNLIRPSGWIVGWMVSLALAGCSPSATSTGGSARHQAIVNGTAVTRLSSLSSRLVFILIRDDATKELSGCSGSLLPGNIVLTAAHCVQGAGSTAVIGFGASVQVSASLMTSSEMRKVIGYRRQPDYSTDSDDQQYSNDVGLLKFAGSVPDTASAFALPFGAGAPVVHPGPTDSVYMTGYGFPSVTDHSAGTLRYLKVPVSRVQNAWSIDKYISISAGTSGICMGDSGAPLAYYQGETPVIWGVTSSARPNADAPGNPCSGTDYFTRVTAQATWLQSAYNDLIGGN